MNPVQELVENQEKAYVRLDEKLRMPATAESAARSRQAIPGEDAELHRMEAGLYPVCERCGERIEIERLHADAFATQCANCAAHASR